MQLYRATSHTRFDLKYHLVWITKYRKPVMTGRVVYRIRELVREICRTFSVQIIKGHVSKDHVHLFISMPPQLSVNKIAQYIKGKTSRRLMDEFPALKKTFLGQHFWARGYFAVSSGSVTDEM
ncbi:IS200/IS605 family transposase, partial [Candidatus Peregrinibacteria bacterium]|nr:IS200/IS605 family transposase [Candidatus Peregrinibacteria bacterium]